MLRIIISFSISMVFSIIYVWMLHKERKDINKDDIEFP